MHLFYVPAPSNLTMCVTPSILIERMNPPYRLKKQVLFLTTFYFLSIQWNDLDAPEAHPFPGKYEETLSDFQRLLLLRCFRVDRVYLAITNFVTGRMGEKYVTPPVISFEAIFEQSTPFSPIIFILSPGSDPASDLMKLAERSGFGGNKLKFLAMGQGQEKVCEL